MDLEFVVRKILQTKYITAAATAASFFYLRNGFMVRLLVAAALNSVLVKFLKRIFNQPRPEKALKSGKKDPGFPSSHAHMLWYLSLYTNLAMDAPGAPEWIPYICLVYAFMGSFWRVHIGRHTMGQVIAGIVSGSLGALLWYAMLSDSFVTKSDELVHYIYNEYPVASAVGTAGISFICFFLMRCYGERISMRTRHAIQREDS
mmetsp:Transcript_10645/g.20937  ORF Transcript_10645/g.20937 Transcript_10645/m.20937 type:complete len:203 (+) Transcript_10645:290-898(+)